MIQILLVFAVILAITVIPVMIAARLVGAQKSGFGSALFALFLQLILGGALLQLGPGPIVALAISVLGGAVVYAFALDTTVLRGFAVSILAGLIGMVVAFFAAGALLTGSAILGSP